MCGISPTRPPARLTAGLLLLLSGALLAAPAPAMAQAPPKPTRLQRAVDRAQQDLMDLREDLQVAGTRTRQSFCDEVQRIDAALQRQFMQAPANDPGLNAARSALGLLDLLVRDCPDRELIPTRFVAMDRLDDIIDAIDEAMGKW
jgi:hypothetical protein